MITPEEQPNQYVESLNYLILLTQDYVNTLPDSSKIAVIAQANKAFESIKDLIENYPKLEEELHRATIRQKKRESELIDSE